MTLITTQSTDLLATIDDRAERLAQARAGQAETEARARAMLDAAAAAVVFASDELDHQRRVLLRTHAAMWRDRAAELRAEAEETPADAPVTLTDVNQPVLAFRQAWLRARADEAEATAKRLDHEGRELTHHSAPANMVRPARSWTDGLAGAELEAACTRSLVALAELDEEADA